MEGMTKVNSLVKTRALRVDIEISLYILTKSKVKHNYKKLESYFKIKWQGHLTLVFWNSNDWYLWTVKSLVGVKEQK